MSLLGGAEELVAATPGEIEELLAFGVNPLILSVGDGARMLGEVGEEADNSGVEHEAKGFVDGLEFESDECIVERGHAAAFELVAEAAPGLFAGGMEFAPVEEDVALVGVEVKGEAVG